MVAEGATLIIAGTFFMLSVSEIFSRHARRVTFIFFVTAAAILYLTGLEMRYRPRLVLHITVGYQLHVMALFCPYGSMAGKVLIFISCSCCSLMEGGPFSRPLR